MLAFENTNAYEKLLGILFHVRKDGHSWPIGSIYKENSDYVFGCKFSELDITHLLAHLKELNKPNDEHVIEYGARLNYSELLQIKDKLEEVNSKHE